MKVTLISYTPNPERTVAAAARLCYSPVGVEDILTDLNDEEAGDFLETIMQMEHLNTIEHASFTFAVEGVSRVLSHQLVRHRIASYSQQSQRFVRNDEFEYVVPPSIKANPEALEIYEDMMRKIREAYNRLADMVHQEDARYVLPNACETKIILTMNCHSLLNFFRLRCCNKAQWEIRTLAYKMLEEVRKVAPTIFEKAGPSCVSRNFCSEGKLSCGRINRIRAGEDKEL